MGLFEETEIQVPQENQQEEELDYDDNDDWFLLWLHSFKSGFYLKHSTTHLHWKSLSTFLSLI